MSEGTFTWVGEIPGFDKLNEAFLNPSLSPPMADFEGFHLEPTHIAHSVLVMVLLVVLAWIGTKKMRRDPEEALMPDRKFSLRNIWELGVGALYNMVKEQLGNNTDRFFPLIGTLFIFIFCANLLGVFPGFLPPTSNVNINAGMAILVFIMFNYAGIKAKGLIGYLKHFTGPILVLAPLMFVVEIIGVLVRPLSLSLRLFGNITGDHLVLAIFTDLTKLIIPVIFLGLGVFISFIQALVFSLLSTIYIQLALAEEH